MAQHWHPPRLPFVLHGMLPGGTTPHLSSRTICRLARLDSAFVFSRRGMLRWVAPAVTGCQVDACFGLDCGGGGEVFFAWRSSANGPTSWCSDHHPLIVGLLDGQGGCLQWDSWNLVVGGRYIATMPFLWVFEEGLSKQRLLCCLPLSGSYTWPHGPAYAVLQRA